MKKQNTCMVLADRISIESMRAEDIARVTEIDRLAFPTPWPRDAYDRELRENRLARYFVARVLRQIVGYAGMWMILDEAHVTTLAVAPEYRRRRVGEYLLAALLEEAMRRGSRWITLEVRKSNLPAQALYRKWGFKEIGIRKGYYSDNREDAIVMWTGHVYDHAFQERFTRNRATLGSP